MKESWKKFRGWALLISCCVFLLGALMIWRPNMSALILCTILGAICLAIGIGELCRYFSLGVAGLFFKFDLAIGLVNILLGILLLLHPLDAIVFLPIAAGLFILIGSSFDIQLAVEMHHLGAKHWWLTMALGILSTIFAFFLIFDPFNGTTALMIFAGISLIVSSIESFYLIVCISKAVKFSKDDDIIDVTWTEL